MDQLQPLHIERRLSFRLLLLLSFLAFFPPAHVHGQAFSVLYNFGTNPYDPIRPVNPGNVTQGFDGNLYSTTPMGGHFNSGTVFMFTNTGQLSVLAEFDSQPHGYYPNSGLVLASDGTFYGTTSGGGPSFCGTVFNVTSNGQVRFVHDFTCADGSDPNAIPIQASDGKLYGTATYGGDFNCGTVYKLTQSGQFTLLHSFDCLNDGGHPSGPLSEGTDGAFYGTTYDGAAGYGTVFRLTTTGKIRVLHVFSFDDGARPWAGLSLGSDGALYGTTSDGGLYGYGVVFRVSNNNTFQVLHSFDQLPAPNPISALVQASNGSFYGTTSSIPNSNGSIYQLAPGGGYSDLHFFDGTHGAGPLSTLVQHTTGVLYGQTFIGGTHSNGTFFKFDLGLPAFISLVPAAGRVGSSIHIIGQGLTGATAVRFNGVPARFRILSDTSLVTLVPNGAGTGAVSVVLPTGNLKSIQKFRVIP